MDDSTCLEHLQQGGRLARTAITTLHERYARKFYKYLQDRRFSLSHEKREDIVQETFIRLIQLQGKPFNLPIYPKAWLYRILYYTACSILKRPMRETLETELQNSAYCDETSGFLSRQSGDLLSEVDMNSLGEALKAFQNDYPEASMALELVILEGWSLAELATFLNKSEGATRQYLFYWRQRFRDALERYYPPGSTRGWDE